MKTKTIICAALSAVCMLTACTNADEFHDVLYFTGTETSPVSQFTINGPADLGITVTASCLVNSDQTIDIKPDTAMLSVYNHKHGKDYKLVPEGAYHLQSNEVILKQGNNVSEPLVMSLTSTDALEEGATYCLPLTITNVKGGMEVLESSRTVFVVLNQQIITNGMNLRGSASGDPHFEKDASLASVPCVSMEARFKVNSFQSRSPYISSLMGLEENFLLRFGDVTIKPNQIQLAGGGYPVTGKTEFETNKWYHVAVVYDGSTIKLYVNGQLDAQTDAPRGPISLHEGGFYVGKSAGGRLLKGTISEMRVWKKALSQSEIQNNMCYVSPDKYGDLVAYWRFNEGNGTVVKDWSGHGWDINMSGSYAWEEGVKCPE